MSPASNHLLHYIILALTILTLAVYIVLNHVSADNDQPKQYEQHIITSLELLNKTTRMPFHHPAILHLSVEDTESFLDVIEHSPMARQKLALFLDDKSLTIAELNQLLSFAILEQQSLMIAYYEKKLEGVKL